MIKAGSRRHKSARQAFAYARGEVDATAYGGHVPDRLDVQALWHRVDMPQEACARYVGVRKRTGQDWEQGRRHPSGLVRVFLIVLDRAPAAVRRALSA